MTGWWLLLLLGCGDLAATPTATEDPFETALDDPVYRFCHEAGIDRREALRWCELLDDLPEDRCPGLRETCTSDIDRGSSMPPPSGCNPPPTGENNADGGLSGAPERPKPPPKSGCDDIDSMDALASLAKWVTAIAVALLVLFVLRLILLYVGRREDADLPPAPPPVIFDEDDGLDDVPQLPSSSLLEQAQQALQRGDLGRAVELARGAALRHMGGLGWLTLHRSRTDREYLQRARAQDRQPEALKTVLDAVEHYRWEGSELSEPQARAAVQAAARIVAATVVLLVAVPAFAQNTLMSRFGPSGDTAIADALERAGHQPRWRNQALERLPDQPDAPDMLWVDLEFVTPTEADWDALREWVEGGGVALFAGDPSDAFPEVGTLRTTTGPVPMAISSLPWGWDPIPAPVLPEGARQVYVEALCDPMVWSAEGPVLLRCPIGQGWALALSEPRLLLNGALVHPDNEQFLTTLPDWLVADAMLRDTDSVVIDLATTMSTGGERNNNPAMALANSNLLPLVLQVLLLWLVIALWKGWPFGPLKDSERAGRQSFAEHIQALAARYQSLGASRYAAHLYAALWWRRLGSHALLRAAERAGIDNPRDFVERVEAYASDGDGIDDGSDLTFMEELWKVTQAR